MSNAAPGQTCFSCGVTQTPLWRRDAAGHTICNACGLSANRAAGRSKAKAAAIPAETATPTPAVPTADEAPPNSCPGDGFCNGTGGKECCRGCPVLNNRLNIARRQKALPSVLPDPPTTAQSPIPTTEVNGQSTPQAEAPKAEPDQQVTVCSNCETRTTPLWRRDNEGKITCNACSLFQKLHGRPRPINMKKPNIKRRKRNPPARAPQAEPDAKRRKVASSSGTRSPSPSTLTQKDSPPGLSLPLLAMAASQAMSQDGMSPSSASTASLPAAATQHDTVEQLMTFRTQLQADLQTSQEQLAKLQNHIQHGQDLLKTIDDKLAAQGEVKGLELVMPAVKLPKITNVGRNGSVWAITTTITT